MAFCASCGTQMADDAAFCPACGKPAGQPGSAAPAPSAGPNVAATPIDENIAGMLAYFTIIPAIIFLLIEPYNRNRFVRFHSFQCLFTAVALFVVRVGLSVMSMIVPFLVIPLWGLFVLACLALWLLLVIKAYQHDMFKLPIVGDLAEKQANA